MQSRKAFFYLTWCVRVFLILCIFVSVIQNYFDADGTISLFGFTLTQFYPHAELRILPLLWVSLFLVPSIKRIFKVEGDFHLTDLLVAILVAVDAYTHVSSIYSYNFTTFWGLTVWFDKIMHFAEGVVLLIAFYPIVYRAVIRHTKGITASTWTYWLTAGLMSIFFILWEITEVLVDASLGTTLITDRFDTNEDLTAAYIGIVLGYVFLESKRKMTLQHGSKQDVENQMLRPNVTV
jgi:hypothetical protein